MTDSELIKEVARLWVENGGDVDGFDWCSQKIKDAIKSELIGRSQALGEI